MRTGAARSRTQGSTRCERLRVGELTIQLRDGDVTVRAGQLFVVPRGVEHCPIAGAEVHALLIEPKGVINTGEAGGALTAAYDDSLI